MHGRIVGMEANCLDNALDVKSVNDALPTHRTSCTAFAAVQHLKREPCCYGILHALMYGGACVSTDLYRTSLFQIIFYVGQSKHHVEKFCGNTERYIDKWPSLNIFPRWTAAPFALELYTNTANSRCRFATGLRSTRCSVPDTRSGSTLQVWSKLSRWHPDFP